jgi:predicted XRE-type DNA-binding protein
MNIQELEHHEFSNVWDALTDTPEESANMSMRSNLLIAIQKKIQSWNITQAEAAQRLRVTQPRLNDLLRNKIDKFSLDMLINLGHDAGLTITLDIAA